MFLTGRVLLRYCKYDEVELNATDLCSIANSLLVVVTENDYNTVTEYNVFVNVLSMLECGN